MALHFEVFGKPQPAGSKRAFAIKKGGVPTGRVAVMDANRHAKSWQQEVQAVAFDAARVPLRGPLRVAMTFYLRRPKAHYGTGRNAERLKESAPPLPIGRPDSLKLARGTEDALTGTVWVDDAQVVELTILKRYGLPERCIIEIDTAAADLVLPVGVTSSTASRASIRLAALGCGCW